MSVVLSSSILPDADFLFDINSSDWDNNEPDFAQRIYVSGTIIRDRPKEGAIFQSRFGPTKLSCIRFGDHHEELSIPKEIVSQVDFIGGNNFLIKLLFVDATIGISMAEAGLFSLRLE